jgi:predicted nuclease of predicted toxin-antitoxin system
LFSDSAHVRQLGFDTADDDAIWRYAEKFGFTIISKDTDFQQRSFLFGHPPKVIWVALSDASTTKIANLIRLRYQEIVDFQNDPAAA